MAKLTAKERAVLARQILAADDEDEDGAPETVEKGDDAVSDADDDYVIYKGKKYRPEVVEDLKEEAEAEDEKETPAPKKRRFVT